MPGASTTVAPARRRTYSERRPVVVVEQLPRREPREHDEDRRHEAHEAEAREDDEELLDYREHSTPSTIWSSGSSSSGTLVMMASPSASCTSYISGSSSCGD